MRPSQLGTATDTAQALGTGIGRHRASASSGARKRGALALACLLVLTGLFTAPSALGGVTHPFQSEFTGSDTPDGSLSQADKVAVRQSTGDVYVIDKNHGVVDTFDASGNYLSQIGGFGSFGSSDPDLAVDNSATASEGNLYVLPEFGPLSAYDSSGTLLYQLDGSTTPIGDFGDVCGTAVDSSGIVYVADYSNQVIYKFDSSGAYLTTLSVGFNLCDIAVDTDGTIWAVQWGQSLHKVAPDGTDLGVIDDQNPRGVAVDLVTHHVFAVHDTSVIEYDSDGDLVSEFGAGHLVGSRGADVNGTTGQVYVSSNPPAGSRVVVFGPLVPVPDAITGLATNVQGTSATLNGHADPAGAGDITECHFEYGTDTSYGNTVPCAQALPITSPTDVSADISGLTQSTIYHFTLVVASSSAGSVSGADQTFQTTGPPIVQSQPATNVTETGATLNAAIDPAGFQTTCVFEYVDDATFQASGFDAATSVPCVPPNLGSVGGTFVQASADVSGLASSTVYHFRAVATNAAGTTNGADTTFRTAGVPAVVSESATNITDTTATLNASIIPSGFETTCEFQYVSDAAFQGSGYGTATSVPCDQGSLGSSFDPQSATATATGLTPGTTYHFRVVATNAAGTTNGADTTFQTLVSFLIQVGAFGGSGTLAGQFQVPLGVAVDQRGGKVYVADAGNARVQKFNKKGTFLGAWGWGVTDGTAVSQVCKTKTNCQAGIPGAGAGQFAAPTSVAVDSSKSPSKGSVYVGDAGNNVVQKFNRNGKYMSTIDGSSAPQGAFVSVAGVAVDQSGNLWVADTGTGNVVAFDSAGSFVQQWASPSSTIQAIVVDSTHDAVYLINGSGATERFTLTGGSPVTIDSGSGTALALNPQSGNLYVDHGDDVVVYDPSGTRIDTLFSLGAATNSRGLAYYATGHGSSAGRRDRLFVTDASNNNVTIYGPPDSGAPFIISQSTLGAGKTAKTLVATIVPLGRKTTCTFQLVTSAEFDANGYANAMSFPCTPADLGKSFNPQQASATVTGLTVGAFYHFRVVATNSGGSTTGADQTFQAGPGAWTPFSRCPVDDPAMLATDGVSLTSLCVASNSSHGSITIGTLPPSITGNSNLQGGLVADVNNGIFTFISPAAGALVGDPVEVTAGGFTVIATVESAGTPTDFDLLAGISVGIPILTLPVKIHLVGQNIDLGPSCFIGSEANPIVLHPANTDVSNAVLDFVMFDPDGTLNPNGPLSALIVSNTTQGDSTFAVPGVTGCGPNGDGSLDAVVNAVVGLPSPAGANNLVLEDAGSALALPGTGVTGAQFSAFWHSAFD